ncbi:MAG TPA: hypothetical protein VEY07_06590 [Thermoplasmata archaeon]|nr:hypothetical protein [Thermoplasmata archaeon]
MALLSDIDWIILLAVGAFLLFGKESGAVLRQLGGYYGRMARLKQELLADFSRAADLPAPVAGRPITMRSALVQMVEPGPVRVAHAPLAVTTPPVAPWATGIMTGPQGAGVGPGTWSLAVPAVRREEWGP